MQYEVYVPFAVSSVRSALAEPERVARCVPGYQPDDGHGSAGATPGTLTGRLRVRIGGSSITYRGSLALTARADGLVAEGSGTEVRGDGTATFALTVTARPADDGVGTLLDCSGTVKGGGRLAEYDAKQVTAAGRRLLDRFGTALAESLAAGGAVVDPPEEPTSEPDEDPPVTPELDTPEPPPAAGIGAPDDNEPVIPGIPAPDSAESEVDAVPPESGPTDPENLADVDQGGLFDTEVPPPSWEPLRDDDLAEPTAEAAHARRTMIGRSAEEVDHAPPRGRYAPVPGASSPSLASTALRWVVPAAAAVLVSAMVARRVLRRRR